MIMVQPVPGAMKSGIASWPGGSCAIAGTRANAAAGSVEPLGADFGARVRDLYDSYFRASIHDKW